MGLKRTDNDKDEIQGFFAALRMTDIKTSYHSFLADDAAEEAFDA